MSNNDYIEHSNKGWTKKNHKYIRKEGKRYIYPSDMYRTNRHESAKAAINGAIDQDRKRGGDGTTVSYDVYGRAKYGKMNRAISGRNGEYGTANKRGTYQEYNIVDSNGNYVEGYDQGTYSRPTEGYYKTRQFRRNARDSKEVESNLDKQLKNLDEARNHGMPTSDYKKARNTFFVRAIQAQREIGKRNKENAMTHTKVVRSYIQEMIKRFGSAL